MSALVRPGEESESFTIDLSQPPYEVPCPVCFAFALEPCRTEPREFTPADPEASILKPWLASGGFSWPASSRKIHEPHPARWEHWRDHPEYRVKAIRT